MTIPMSQPDITSLERAAVLQALGTGTLSIGPWLDRFEEAMRARLGVRHAAGVSSGTAGLHLALLAAGVGDDDLVVTTPFSFVASVNCILYCRARPVLVDVEPTALTIDAEQVADAVRRLADRAGTRGGRLKAILPVHVFGQPADMDPILAVARRYGLAVIEDACEALGATYRGRPAGALGDAGVFGFYPNKQVTTGEGGMVVTSHPGWDASVRSLRNQGRDLEGGWLEHARLGYNYRLDELSAALGAVQLARLDELLAARARVAAWYRSRLERIEGVALPAIAPWTTRASWFVYVVRVAAARRDGVLRALAAQGIPARVYFPPIHLQPYHRAVLAAAPGDFPVAEAAGATCLALPFSGRMREAQVDEVCGALAEALHGAAPRRASA